MTPKALEATLELEKEGVHARLIHMPTIKPLDVEAIVQASKETGQIITVENHSRLGGLGGAVAETLTEHAPCRLCAARLSRCFRRVGRRRSRLQQVGRQHGIDFCGGAGDGQVRKTTSISEAWAAVLRTRSLRWGRELSGTTWRVNGTSRPTPGYSTSRIRARAR